MHKQCSLPSGWEWKTIEKTFKIKSGDFLPSKCMFENGQYSVYGGNGINGKHNLCNLNGENIIIGRVGALCGNVRYITEDIWLTDNAFYISDYKCDINKKYLTTFLSFIDLGKTSNQSAQPVISYKSIQNINIPLPPLDEQKRLVSLLDTLFAKIDRSIELLSENITAADLLLPSALNTVFGELTEYKKKNLKDITSKIGSGATPSGGGKAYKESGISLIRSMNVHDYGFRDKNLALIDDQQAQKLNNVTVQENDVLLNITGASVARCCIVDSQYLPARVNQHVAIIRLNEGILPQYVHYYLISPNTKNDLLFNAGGGATREAITKKMIEEFEIPLPPLDIQTQTVEYLDSIRHKVEILKRIQNDKITNLKALKASILDRAFKGEL